jgi:hypothetical protein
VCDDLFLGDLTQLDLSGASQVRIQASLFPHYRQAIAQSAKSQGWQVFPTPRLLPNPQALCGSFTKFYERARREAVSLERCLNEQR